MTTTTTPPAQSTGTRLGQAFIRTHWPTDIIFGVAAVSLLLINYGSMDTWELVGYGVFIVLCVHQMEEYRFPGGFVWGLNTTMGSELPARYPGNALSAVFVDVSTLIVWGLLLFIWPSEELVAFLVLFALVEVLGHIMFGVKVYLRYRSVGKTTIYFPGNVTAFLGFTPVVIWGFYTLFNDDLLSGGEWILVLVLFVAFMVFWLGLPTALLAKKDSPFFYPDPVEGYYLHRYEQKLQAVTGAAGATGPTGTAGTAGAD